MLGIREHSSPKASPSADAIQLKMLDPMIGDLDLLRAA
jgi:hypothetical protein